MSEAISRIIYKCRLCLNLYECGEGKSGDCKDAVSNAMDGRLGNNSVYARMHRIHQCADGGVGVGDLIGCTTHSLELIQPK
jgi:hypothetical protein